MAELDPHLHPQMKQILEMMAQATEGQPKLWELTPIEARKTVEETFTQFWNADAPPIARTLDQEIDGPRGPIPVRLYDPGTAPPTPCLMYFHGGGFVVGSIAAYEGVCRRLANYSGFRVVSVGYRLAPEYKFPAGLDDCVASVCWIAAHGRALGIDPSRLFVGGDSAGANLSLVTATVIRDEGGPTLQGAVLIYGTFDTDLDTPSSKAFGGGEYFLSRRDMEWFFDHYINGPADGRNPRVAPLHADLRGLPPLLVTAAEFDPLLDDSRRLVERLRSIGAPHDWVLWPGVVHACINMTRMLDPAEGFLRDIAGWIQNRSGATAGSKAAGTR